MILANAADGSLERGRLSVVIATVVINIIAVSLLAFAPWSDWRTGAALNVIDNCLLIGFALSRGDALLGRFLLFGLVVGLTELPADAWLVDYTRTLDYSIGGGPMIWRSPLWMPLPDGLLYAVVYHSRRIRDRVRSDVTCADLAAWIPAHGDSRRNWRRIGDLCLLRRRVFHCGPTYPVNLRFLFAS